MLPSLSASVPQHMQTLPTEPPRVSFGEAPRAGLVGLLGIVALAVALRVWALPRQSFSVDEISELIIARGSVGQIVRTHDGFPPLYQVLLHWWLNLFGRDDAARSLSVVVGVLSVAAVWGLARWIAGVRAAHWAAFLLALSPFHIWYSQEARSYILYFFVASVALWAYFRALDTDRTGDWTGYVLACVAGMYVQYNFGVLVLTNVAILATERRSRKRLRRPLVFHLVLGLLTLPCLWLLHQELSAQAARSDIYAPFNLASVAYTYFTFVAGYSVGPSIQELHTASARAAAMAVAPWALALGITIFLMGTRAALALRGTPWFRRLVLLLVAPLVFTGILAEVLHVGYRVRYVAWAAIPLVLIIAIGMARETRMWRLALATLVFVGVGSVSLYNRHNITRYWNEDLRGASAYLQSAAGGGNPVFVVSGYMAAALRYYLGEGWTVRRLAGAKDSGDGLGESLRLIRETAARERCYWVVYTRPFHDDPRGRLKQALLLPPAMVAEEARVPGVVLYRGCGRR